MGIRLYYASGACSFVPHAALETIAAATGERFEYVPVRLHKGEQRTPEYLALNPNGQVPLLMVDERPRSSGSRAGSRPLGPGWAARIRPSSTGTC